MARLVVEKIEHGHVQDALDEASAHCDRWMESCSLQVLTEWKTILQGGWGDVKEVLLDESEEGQRLRQSNPFCGVLSPQERWAVYRRWGQDEAA